MEIQNKQHKTKLFRGPFAWHLLPSFHALQCTWILYSGVLYSASSGPCLAMSLGPRKLTSYFQLKWPHLLPFSSLKPRPCSCKKFMWGFFPELLGIAWFISPCLLWPQVFKVQCIHLNWVHTDCSEPPDIVQDALMSSLRFKGLLCSRLCSWSALGLFATVNGVYLYACSFLFILWSLL